MEHASHLEYTFVLSLEVGGLEIVLDTPLESSRRHRGAHKVFILSSSSTNLLIITSSVIYSHSCPCRHSEPALQLVHSRFSDGLPV